MPKIITDAKKIKKALTRGVEKIYPSLDALEKLLASGKRIKIYCGYDPSAPTLHLGNSITLRKLAQFQKLGHEIIMLIGDFTGMIGDPTDKMATRKKMTRQEVLENSKNYQQLASKFLDFSGENQAKILFNSEWNDKLNFLDLIELTSNFTVQQMIARDMFQERIKNNKPIHLHEFLYPITQAYDSVFMGVDLEIGGSDQIFNMLVGRDLMKAVKNKEKFVLATKLLVDPTGKKMGKSEDNMITLDDKPESIYGKIMSWPDEGMEVAFELLTEVSDEEIKEIAQQLKEEKVNPRDIKAKLAKEVVAVFYDKKAAQEAEEEFEKVFKEHKLPSKITEFDFNVPSMNILELLVKTKIAFSKSEAKRLVEQGAITIGDKKITNWQAEILLEKELIIKAGKRKFAKII